MRYFIARKLGMHVGVDVARGPEDTVVQVNHPRDAILELLENF